MTNNVNSAIVEIIKELADKKKVSVDVVCLSLQDALKKAYEKEKKEEVAQVTIDPKTGALALYKVYTIVDDTQFPEQEVKDKNGKALLDENGQPIKDNGVDDYNQILLSEAKKHDKNAVVGGLYKELIDIKSLDKRVISHMLQVFKQDINIESNKKIYEEWIDKKGTIVYAEVEKIDSRNKSIIVNLNTTYGVVGRFDQNPDENLVEGLKYKFYIKDVTQQTKNWPIILSRASAEIVKDLVTINIPEISNGSISIMKIGRVAGFKTKIAVKSNLPGIDPIGSCIGAKADRIRPILNEMGRERIEFVEWDENVNNYLINACNPAPLIGYNITEAKYEKDEVTGQEKEVSRKKIQLIVDDYKLALIIGSKGKNVRVLSELLDADVEAITVDEATEGGLTYTKAVAPRKAYTNATANNSANTAKPINKFNATLNKYQQNNQDLINSIDQSNSIVDDATINSINPEKKADEPIVQSGEAVNQEDYNEGLEELKKITE